MSTLEMAQHRGISMQANYEHFVERMIFRYEGNYGWDRRDPGGPTKYGITCYDLAQYLEQRMDSMAAWAPKVQAMTLKVADEIYRRKYATAVKFDSLNSGPDCTVFDFGVNSGPSRAIKYAQRIIGTAADGVLGPLTLKAINDMDAATFVNKLCDARMSFLRSLGTWRTFGRGWTARVTDLRRYSLALVQPSRPEVAGHEEKERRITMAFAKSHDEAMTS